MSINKEAAEIIDRLVEENTKLAEDNKKLKEDLHQRDRNTKIASMQNTHGIDEDVAKKMASMDEGEFEAVQSVMQGVPAGTQFGEVEEKSQKVASVTADLENAKQEALDFLDN